MSIFEHSRYRILNRGQHLYTHSLDDFIFTDDRLPGLSRLSEVMTFIVGSIFPKYIGTFANVAALPATANKNDYAVVSDDGDGKAAGYVWSVIDGTARWVKRYDMDWSVDGMAADVIARTGEIYLHKYGSDDLADDGSIRTGELAGQVLYGGASANTNLTLFANAGDAAGVNTGRIQFGDSMKPLDDNTLSLGEPGFRFADGRFVDLYADNYIKIGDTLFEGNGVISNLNSLLNFTDTTIQTTGGVEAGYFNAGSLFVVAGSVYSLGGTIGFGDNELNNISMLRADEVTAGVVYTESIQGAELWLSAQTVHFANSELRDVSALDMTGLRIEGESILLKSPGPLKVLDGPTSPGAIEVGNLSASSGVFSGSVSTVDLGVSGEASIQSISGGNGAIRVFDTTGVSVESGLSVYGGITSQFGGDLGTSSNQWGNLYLNGSIQTASSQLNQATLDSLSEILSGAADGHSLFYNAATGKWSSSRPDTEIDHEVIAGLAEGDAGHTQFVMLTGRDGGQAVSGGTGAFESLTLSSTSHPTDRGSIIVEDDVEPVIDASFTTEWSGVDLGSENKRFRDIHIAGEAKGLRLENLSTEPASSPTKAGRLYFNTSNSSVYVDTGNDWAPFGGARSARAMFSADGLEKTFVVNFTADLQSFRVGSLIQITSDSGEVFYGDTIMNTIGDGVTINTKFPLPAGNYYLSVVEV